MRSDERWLGRSYEASHVLLQRLNCIRGNGGAALAIDGVEAWERHDQVWFRKTRVPSLSRFSAFVVCLRVPCCSPHHRPLNASVHQGLVLGSSEHPHLTHTQSFENYVFITPYYLPSLKPYCLLLGIFPECAKPPQTQHDRNGIHDPLFLKTLGPQHFISQKMALSSI